MTADSHPPRAATATRSCRTSSAEQTSQRGGLSILDADAWRQQSPFSWIFGGYTICAVRLRGQLTFELWHNSAFVARADDAKTLRVVAASGGVS
jgi:hypothetical protein